jgi:type IV pilus assembly protein PilN
MTKINLLDWRAARRERYAAQFRSFMILGVLVAGGLVALGYFAMTGAISQQQARNQYLKQQIAETDQKIKEIEDLEKTKQNLLARMRVIEELQSSRSATVHFFDELVNTIPDGITLTSIKQAGDMVTLEGIAESNGRVSSYIKNFESSQWFSEPRLVIIKTSEKNKQREGQFTLQVKNLTKAVKTEGKDGTAKSVPGALTVATPAPASPAPATPGGKP